MRKNIFCLLLSSCLGLAAAAVYAQNAPKVNIIEGEGGLTAGRSAEALAIASTAGLDNVIIHLDYLHSGLGSNSCGEEQLEENKVKLQDFAMAFTVSAVKCGTEIEEARKQYID